MPSTETLQAIRSYASSLDPEERQGFIEKFNSIKDDDSKIDVLASRISAISKPKPMFSSIEEANAANQQAQREQSVAQMRNRGITPYVDAMSKTAQDVAPFILGGGAGMQLSKLAGNSVLRQAAAGMGGGAVSGLLTPADSLQERGRNVATQTAIGGALGGGLQAVGKGAESFGQILRKLPTRLNDAKSTQFATKIRQAYTNTKAEAVKKFGTGLDELAKNNPNKKIDLFENDNIKDILTDPDLTSEARAVFNRTPILRDMLKVKGARSSEVTVKEAQDIANYLQFKIPQSVKSQHLDIADMVNEVKAAQANAFPKEMASLRSEYGRIAEPFKDLKSKLKLQNALQSIDAGFGGAVQREQLKVLFKDNPELLKEMGGYKGAGRLLKGLKWGAIGTAGAVGTGVAGKAAIDAITRP